MRNYCCCYTAEDFDANNGLPVDDEKAMMNNYRLGIVVHDF